MSETRSSKLGDLPDAPGAREPREAWGVHAKDRRVTTLYAEHGDATRAVAELKRKGIDATAYRYEPVMMFPPLDLSPCPNPSCRGERVWVNAATAGASVVCGACGLCGPHANRHAYRLQTEREAARLWNELPRAKKEEA